MLFLYKTYTLAKEPSRPLLWCPAANRTLKFTKHYKLLYKTEVTRPFVWPGAPPRSPKYAHPGRKKEPHWWSRKRVGGFHFRKLYQKPPLSAMAPVAAPGNNRLVCGRCGVALPRNCRCWSSGIPRVSQA